ncbi:MAG: DUF547 domain-containing protein [Deltaproteobacteria bacterium]|nr:DUF547 domain-containing protein [Deltaproteobacteria bacterium]
MKITKNWINTIFPGFLVLCVYLAQASLVWAGSPVDHSLYAELLRDHVKDGVVDYQGFKTDEAKLDRYLEVLANVDTKTLSPNEQFAFYINAYNAWTIKLILSEYPGIASIKDIGGLFSSPWKKEIALIDGKKLTLDNIENDILRPRFKDPRVHFAINCASKSCPPLMSEPYRGDVLDQQLNRMTEAFVNDPKQNRLDGETLYVSRIFKWYSEDFNDDIVGFFLKYAKGERLQKLREKQREIDVEYLDYDWSLNGK